MIIDARSELAVFAASFRSWRRILNIAGAGVNKTGWGVRG
jgi:hypothetical protein